MPVFWNTVLCTNGRLEKKTDVVFGFRMKNCISPNVVFRFFKPTLNFTVKSQNFHDFSTSKYDISRTVYPIRMIFCQLFTISFPFQIKTEKFLKISKLFRKCVFWPKNAKLATLKKLGHRSKNDCRIRNQWSKIREVWYFSRGANIFADQCYRRHEWRYIYFRLVAIWKQVFYNVK